MVESSHGKDVEVYKGLQALRGYAALSVMVGHAIKEWAATYNVATPFDVEPLLYGVDIFFVISGFIMYRTSRELFAVPGGVRTFALKRLLRIVPLYWLFTTLMVVTLLVLSDHVRSTEFEPWNVISSYLFIPSERPGGRIAPVLSLGWTLNYEMFFYAIFAAALMFPRRLGVSLLVATIVGLVIYGAVFQPNLVALRFWTSSIILEFAAGVVLAVVIGKRAPLPVSLALLAIGAVLLQSRMFGFAGNLPRCVAGGIPATFLVAGVTLLPRIQDARVPAWATVLGDSSYALYLGHRFVLRAATIVFDGLPLANPAGLAIYCITVTAIAVVMSIVVFHWIERPMLAQGRRLLFRQRSVFAEQ